jgi:hypothetical protein
MNSRRLNRSNCIRSPYQLRPIELAKISQWVREPFHSRPRPSGAAPGQSKWLTYARACVLFSQPRGEENDGTPLGLDAVTRASGNALLAQAPLDVANDTAEIGLELA